MVRNDHKQDDWTDLRGRHEIFNVKALKRVQVVAFGVKLERLLEVKQDAVNNVHLTSENALRDELWMEDR